MDNKIIIAFKQLEILENDLKEHRKRYLSKKQEFFGLMRNEARK